jgi:hypothetical protein
LEQYTADRHAPQQRIGTSSDDTALQVKQVLGMVGLGAARVMQCK